jgi:hypothetical protein
LIQLFLQNLLRILDSRLSVAVRRCNRWNSIRSRHWNKLVLIHFAGLLFNLLSFPGISRSLVCLGSVCVNFCRQFHSNQIPRWSELDPKHFCEPEYRPLSAWNGANHCFWCFPSLIQLHMDDKEVRTFNDEGNAPSQ